MIKRQSFIWYIPIVFVLILGYGVGLFVFGLHFLNWFPSLTDNMARLTIELFGMGIIGANMYCTQWWAKDLEAALQDDNNLPNAFDFIAYATLIVGGGITGIILNIAIKSGILLVITNSSNIEINTTFSFFISFCGGLFHFKVREFLEDVLNKILKYSNEKNL